MIVTQLDEVHRRVRVGELGIFPFAPGSPAVVRLGAHQPAVGPTVVIASAPAEGDEMVRRDLNRSRLNVPQT